MGGAGVWPLKNRGRAPLVAPTNTSNTGTGSTVAWGPCRGRSCGSSTSLLVRVCRSSFLVCSYVCPRVWLDRWSRRHGTCPLVLISTGLWRCCYPLLALGEDIATA